MVYEVYGADDEVIPEIMKKKGKNTKEQIW
jgi:hypothetical protein